MTKLQRKITQWALISFSIALNIFIIIFSPCLVCIIWNNIIINDCLLVISILLPFLVSVICFLLSDRFKEFTKEDALRQLENQFNKGLIDMEHFKQQYKHIEIFDLEKKKLKALIEVEKEQLKDNIKVEAKSIVNELKERVLDNEENMK